MKIGILSDTHGSLYYTKRALKALHDCEILIHGGDILYHGPRNDLPKDYNPKEVLKLLNELDNIIFAKGNCDSDVDQMVIEHPIQNPYTTLVINGKKILINHGYTMPREEFVEYAKKQKADILIMGHTHIKENFIDDTLLVINPGSTSLHKDGSNSVCILDINDSISAKFIDLDTNEFVTI